MLILIAIALCAPAPSLLIKKPWVPANGEIVVSTWPIYSDGQVSLMKHDGTPLGDPITFTGEEAHLTANCPELLTVDHAVYAQLMLKDKPLGQPLVIIPACSRLVPVTEEIVSEDRGNWTKIVAWQDEGAEDSEDLPPDAGLFEGTAYSEESRRDESVVRSGWWIRPELDVALETSMGSILIDMREDAAPNTVRNFQQLVRDQFYDETMMHRIIIAGRSGRPFVIQGGDPTGTGNGGPGWWAPIEASTLPHDFGVISMARANDPDSAGSQWFIALDREETARLDGLYCTFGEVLHGRDTIVKLAQVPIGDTDYLSSRPITPPLIKRARLKPAKPRTPSIGRSLKLVEPPQTGPWKPDRDLP